MHGVIHVRYFLTVQSRSADNTRRGVSSHTALSLREARRGDQACN